VSLDELYRQVILDHYRKPRHAGHIEGADARAEGQNPLCGDEVTVELRIEDRTVTEVAVRGRGCSISQASGSMMADKLIGLSTTQIDELVHQVKRLLDIEPGDPGVDPDRPGAVLGDLEALAGVRRFPVRIKCADLPWATLQEALAGVE
jgi:nitrogen fixation NifU-like protein